MIKMHKHTGSIHETAPQKPTMRVESNFWNTGICEERRRFREIIALVALFLCLFHCIQSSANPGAKIRHVFQPHADSD